MERLHAIGRQAGVSALAVTFYDYASDLGFSLRGGRTFHAASTIKLAILLALYRAAEAGRLQLKDQLHVRNRFASQVPGAPPFFLSPDRDGDPDLYKHIGRTASLSFLANTMIVRSSNLATNLLVDHLGVSFITETLAAAGLESLHCRRGVEDEAAFGENINNQIDADGLLLWLRRVHENRAVSEESREAMFGILFRQKFNGMIPAGLPNSAKARVAHKTGEISTVCHDAGMIFLPEREPYALVVLTEYAGAGSAASRNRAIAAVSSTVFHFLAKAHAALSNGESAARV